MNKKDAKNIRLSLEWGTVVAVVVALIAGKDTIAKGGVIGLCVFGSLALIGAMWEQGWLQAPVPVGTPVRASVLVAMAVVLMASLGWFVFPKSTEFPAPPASVNQQPREPFNEPEPTLRTLMMAFGGNAFRTVQSDTLSFTDGTKVTFDVALVLNYPAGSKFMTIYIPTFQHTKATAIYIADNMRHIRGELATVKGAARSPGESPQTANSLVDTGRVYLYEEDFLNHRQMADIEAAYAKQHLHVELRGPDYLTNAQLGWAQRKYGK
jgi:hypothetical protein